MSQSNGIQANQETLQDLIQLVEDSLAQAKQAYIELEQERNSRIRLEKVASERQAAPKVDRDLVNQTVNALVRHDYLDREQMDKFAAELEARPENALKLVNRLLEISAPSYTEGRGIPKQAGESPVVSDEDAIWLRVIHEGA